MGTCFLLAPSVTRGEAGLHCQVHILDVLRHLLRLPKFLSWYKSSTRLFMTVPSGRCIRDQYGIYFYFPGLVLRWRQEDADNNTQFSLHPLKSILDILLVSTHAWNIWYLHSTNAMQRLIKPHHGHFTTWAFCQPTHLKSRASTSYFARNCT